MPRLCSHCGKPLPEGSRFCMECGSPVTEQNVSYPTQPQMPQQQICPGCGQPLIDGAAFCMHCGQMVTPPQQPVAPPPQPIPVTSASPRSTNTVLIVVMIVLLVGFLLGSGLIALIIFRNIAKNKPRLESSVTDSVWEQTPSATMEGLSTTVFPATTAVWMTTTTAASTSETTLPEATAISAESSAVTETQTTPSAAQISPQTTATQTAPSQTAPPQTANPQTAPPQTAPPQTAAPQTAPAAAPPAELDGSSRPSIADFGWINDYSGAPSGCTWLSFPDYLGDWKAIFIYPEIGANELVNVNLDPGQSNLQVKIDWYLMNYDGEAPYDETGMEDSILNGYEWGNGIQATGVGTFTIDEFYQYNGRQYAVGSLALQDGSVAFVAMVR